MLRPVLPSRAYRHNFVRGGDHDDKQQYNGSKQLYVNQVLVYSVEKECTDGMMNSWVLPLSFGRVVLRLTNKLLSKSGFQYTLTLGDDMVLFKTKS